MGSGAANCSGAATKALQQELKGLQKEPLEGFTVKLIADNLFEWEVAIFGKIIGFYKNLNLNFFFLQKVHQILFIKEGILNV